MTVVNMKNLLNNASVEKYGIGAFNVTDLDMVRGVIAAAEMENSPVILQFAEVHKNYAPLEVLAPIMVDAARNTKVPVVVHLDHAETFDTILQAMHLGFSSVMIDASKMAYEDNIATTREIVKIAHALNVSVEAELGTMNREGGETNDFYDTLESTFTDPKIAKDFVTKTGIDALAVAFGTVHGVYTKKPHLDFKRLAEINNEVDVPLVMHGGSGLSDFEYQEAIRNGVRKINYYSTLAYNVANSVKEKLNKETKQIFISDVSLWVIDLIKEDVSSKMRVFQSSGKA